MRFGGRRLFGRETLQGAARCALPFLATVMLIAGTSLGSQQDAPQTASGSPSLEGTWEGTLGGQLRLIVTIGKSNGTLSGTLNSVDQGATLPIESATQSGTHVRFEVGKVGGIYEGDLNAAGAEIIGTWTQTGVPAQPLALKRSTTGRAPAPSAAAQPEHTPKPLTAPIDVKVQIAPTAFEADGKWHLVYELHVWNLGKWDCTLSKVEVLNENADGAVLGSFDAGALPGMMSDPGLDPAEATKAGAKIFPGRTAVVFLWVTVAKREDVPAAIRHRISMKVGDYSEDVTIETQVTPVERKPVVVISSPLRGGEWSAGNGPSNSSPHRRALIPIGGRGYISQRFAIDWVRLYPDGKTFHGDPSDNKNYRAYGAEIHAVADGVVTDLLDTVPQNTPGAKELAVPITLETVGGNHVIMKIGEGLYAFYAHMQPGSVRVKIGDHVHRGQVLGLLGNSGNSSEPHLHFHICNSSSELGCEGLPYQLDNYELQGKGDGWKPSESHPAPVKQVGEIPSEDEVVQFSASPQGG